MSFNPLTAIHFLSALPGSFTKSKEPLLNFDRPEHEAGQLSPCVVKIPGVGYRLFYSGQSVEQKQNGSWGSLLSASSGDGLSWRKDPLVRLNADALEADGGLVGAEVVPLPHGAWRMYFQIVKKNQPHVIGSAYSDDTMNWRVEEGIRVERQGYSVGTPRLIYLSDRKVRLYYHRYSFPHHAGDDFESCLCVSESSDGLNFSDEKVIFLPEGDLESHAIYSPEVLRFGENNWCMYYAGWQKMPLKGRVFLALSKDGLHWEKNKQAVIDTGTALDEKHVSEPHVIQLKDGRFLMSYEACDENGLWRLAYATNPV